ncbi:MAG: helix-hairpin-helix domain-containing protein, partial [Promethearchaeota archaeon]
MNTTEKRIKKEEEERLDYNLTQEVPEIDVTSFESSQTLHISMGRQDLTKINGVGPCVAEKLITAGFDTIEKIAKTTTSQLSSIKGIGETSARKILEGVKYLNSSLNLNNFSKPSKPEVSKKETTTEPKKWFNDKFKRPKTEVWHAPPTIKSALKQVEELEEWDDGYDFEEFNEVNSGDMNFLPLDGAKELKTIELEPPQQIQQPVVLTIQSTEQEEKLNLEEINTVATLVENHLTSQGFHIVSYSPDLRYIHSLLDKLAVKEIQINELLDLVMILPIKINNLRGELQIYSEMVKYKPHRFEYQKNGSVFKVLLDSYFNQLQESHKVINTELENEGALVRNLNSTNNIEVSLKKTKFSKGLFFKSGAQQIKILVEPILICQNSIQFLEKIIPFAYIRDINTHVVQTTQIPDLLTFLEKKYKLLEQHQKEDQSIVSFEASQKQFWKHIEYISFPFMVYGAILILILILQSFTVLGVLMDIGYALFGVYAISFGYLILRLMRQKSEVASGFSIPYYKKNPELDDTSMVLINEE